MNKLPEQSRIRVHYVEIDASRAGQRIDNFLLGTCKRVPRPLIYRLIRKGQVRVNRRRIRPDYRLRTGDQVRIPPLRVTRTAPDASPRGVAGQLESRILYEDERLLILNKPSGLAVHGGSGLSYGVIEALRVLRPGAPYLELVHRLDKDTSGCLMIAKKRSVLRHLHTLLREGGISKHYLTLVLGSWKGGRRVIREKLKKQVDASGERKVHVTSEGKQSVSVFEPLRRFQGASLMRVTLQTGRTHQIRVHAAHTGHPVAGDTKYGDRAFNRRLRELGLQRLFLHASGLEFNIPGADIQIKTNAPLDPALEQVLSVLRENRNP